MWETFFKPIQEHLPLWLMLTPLACAVSLALSRLSDAATQRTLHGKMLVSLTLCAWMVFAYEPNKLTTSRERLALFGPIERVQLRSSFSWLGDIQTEVIPQRGSRGERLETAVLRQWGPDIRLETGIDGVSLWFVLLTVISLTVAIFKRCDRAEQESFTPASSRSQTSLVPWLLLESSLIGTFVALDVILFVIAWTSSVFLIAWLLETEGGTDRHTAAREFLRVQLLGIGLVVLGLSGVVLSFGWLRESAHRTEPPLVFSIPELTAGITRWTTTEDNVYLWTTIRPWLFGLLWIGFTGPMLLAPFHRTFQAAMNSASPGLAIVLAAIVTKLGLFGWWRFLLPLFSDVVFQHRTGLMTLFSASGLLAALLTFSQPTWSRRIALATASSLSLALVNLTSSTVVGLNAGLIRGLSHGLVVSLLLWLLSKSENAITSNSGHWQESRRHRLALRLALWAWIGMPGLSGFLPEFLTPLSLIPHEFNAALLCLTTSGVIAWMWVRSESDWSRERNKETWMAMPSNETWGNHVVTLTLVALIVCVGVAPHWVLRSLQPSVPTLLPTPLANDTAALMVPRPLVEEP